MIDEIVNDTNILIYLTKGDKNSIAFIQDKIFVFFLVQN